MARAKVRSIQDGRAFLQGAFSAEQRVLELQLQLSTESITHPGTLGDVNEQYFIDFLRKYLPHRYAIDKAIVIDSTGNTSDQIDIVIFDRQYTPTLLDQESHRYVPSEAVYAVFEAKPTINKACVKYASSKAQSVRKLTRTSVPIQHAGGQFPAKKPFPIVAGIVASTSSWQGGFSSASFKTLITSLKPGSTLDCGLAVSGSCFDTYDGRIVIGPGKQALSYFVFRLLQKLQSLGTVPAIDWNAYAAVLKKAT
jgi:hypothetical protein